MILFLHITRVQRVIFISFYGWWQYTFTSWLWYVTIVPVCVRECVLVYMDRMDSFVRVFVSCVFLSYSRERSEYVCASVSICVCVCVFTRSCFSYTRTTCRANDRDGACACSVCMGESKCILQH